MTEQPRDFYHFIQLQGQALGDAMRAEQVKLLEAMRPGKGSEN